MKLWTILQTSHLKRVKQIQEAYPMLGKENHLHKCPAKEYLYLYFGGYMVQLILLSQLKYFAFVAAENPPPFVCQLILLSNVIGSIGSICPLESHLLEEEVLVATSVGKVSSDCGDPTPPDLDRDRWQGTEAEGFQVRNLRISRGVFGGVFSVSFLLHQKKPGEKSQVLKLGRWDLT